MFFWTRFPFIRFILFFIAGIVIGIFLPNMIYTIMVLTVVVGSLYLLLYFQRRFWLIKINLAYGLNLVFLAFSLGYIVAWWHADKHKKLWLGHTPKIEAYQGNIASEVHQTGRFYRLVVQVDKIRSTVWQKGSGKVLLYVENPGSDVFDYGDEVLIKGSPTIVNEPRNPNEFNYKQYLENQNIYYQHFVGDGEWLKTSSTTGLSLFGLADNTRNYLEGVLERTIADEVAQSMAKALILGNRDEIEPDVLENFARAGVMHVLAVSGLHVGIIYLILLLILTRSSNAHQLSVPKIFVILLILWSYAFVTGLSPSVLRATTMFSLIAVGQAIGRRSDVYNTLAVSAFILLCINPYLVLSVGFQLSYVAVTGILLLYPLIIRWYAPANSVVRFFWQIVALSLAAQLATLPLSLFYFHRFPTYFLVSNLLVIPAITLAMWLGVMLLLFGSFSLLIGQVLGTVLSWLLSGLNAVLDSITQLPIATFERISPDIIELLLLYLIIIFGGIFLLARSRKVFVVLSFVIILTAANRIYTVHKYRATQQIVFYSVNNSWAIDLIANQHYLPVMDDNLAERTINYSIDPHRLALDLQKSVDKPAMSLNSDLGQLFVWKGIKILITDACTEVKELPLWFDFVLLVKDEGNKCYRDQILFRKLVDEDGERYEPYDLYRQGAFVYNL